MKDTQPIDRTGSFRGKITNYAPSEGKNGSLNLKIEAVVTGIWDDSAQEWDDSWEQYCMVAEGQLCIVKNDKTLNDYMIRALIEYAGWDGSMMSIYTMSWTPKPVAFTVEEEIYKDRSRLRIGFINSYDGKPGAGAGISEEVARSFDVKYGSKLRAMAGNSARTAERAQPKSPRPAPPPKAPASIEPEKGKGDDPPPTDDIPF